MLRPHGAWYGFIGAVLLLLLSASPARCQGVPDVHVITNNTPVLLAQGAPAPTPGVLPTDATKGNFLQDQASVYPGFQLRLSQMLPARMWIQSSTEVNQRLDTNVFLTYKKPQPDYVFRVAPNVTVGYNIFDQTSVYAQYFMIKDVYTVHHRPLTEPVTQSIAMGLRHYIIPYQSRFQTYLDIQARELFQSKDVRQADLNPSINANATLSPHFGLFASALMQMRSQQLFLGPTREIDPFYTFGYWYRRGPWVFNFTDTFVTNFREPHFRHSVPAHGNCNMIADFEIDRQLGNHPGMQVFVRAEPVFNWRSANAVGLSGFDFRLYSGVRFSFYKQSYLASMNQIKKQLQQQDADSTSGPPGAKTKGKKGKGKGKSDGQDGDKKDGDGKDNGGKDGGKKSPTSPDANDPGKTSAAPDAAPVSVPAAAYAPDAAMGEALGRAFGAIVAPGAGAIMAPVPTATPVPTAASEKTVPMAHKIESNQKIGES